jgi:hypothetical protein
MIFKSSQINVFHDIDILLDDDFVEIGWKDETENIQEHQRNIVYCCYSTHSNPYLYEWKFKFHKFI